jgi:hypothetical protein
MLKRHASSRFLLALSGAFVGAFALGSVAQAEEEEIVVRERVYYPIEVEPHFAFGAENVYGVAGFGGGLRVSIPFAAGRLGRVSDNIGITFGGDILHYDNCLTNADCGANYLMIPVAAQWNILVARRVSLLFEGGAYLYKGWFDTCGPGCAAPSDFGVLPTVAVGGRIHIGPNTALLLRVGYPMATFGVSFL